MGNHEMHTELSSSLALSYGTDWKSLTGQISRGSFSVAHSLGKLFGGEEPNFIFAVQGRQIDLWFPVPFVHELWER